jgi:hypothetical protein
MGHCTVSAFHEINNLIKHFILRFSSLNSDVLHLCDVEGYFPLADIAPEALSRLDRKIGTR